MAERQSQLLTTISTLVASRFQNRYVLYVLRHFIVLQAVTRAGVPRMRTEVDRGGQRWHAREVLEPKDESWMDDIAKETLKVNFIDSISESKDPFC